MVFALHYLAMAMYHHTHCLCVLRGFLLSADTLLHGICHSSEMNSIAHRYGYYTMMHTSQSYLTDMGTIQLHVSKLCLCNCVSQPALYTDGAVPCGHKLQVVGNCYVITHQQAWCTLLVTCRLRECSS